MRNIKVIEEASKEFFEHFCDWVWEICKIFFQFMVCLDLTEVYFPHGLDSIVVISVLYLTIYF